MKLIIKTILAFFFFAGLLIVSGCGCKQANSHRYNLSLEVWGTQDYNDALQEAFNSYEKIDPNITSIIYKKIATDTYKKELVDALASGQGPDIFLLNNTWLPSFNDKIVPAPVAPSVIDEQKFRNNFVDVAATDFVDSGKVYAVPLTVDSLALYYNKDLFNQAGITAPPADWNQFIADVRKLTKVDATGGIAASAAAIGTVYNINRSTDVLSLIMLQDGTKMIGDNGQINFDNSTAVNNQTVFPGEDALNFYTQFASSSSPNYTWNPSQDYSIDAFAEGKTAMMLNYSWHMATVAQKAPKLNFGVAFVPQFPNTPKVNFANYWAFGVAKNKIAVSSPYGGTKSNVAPVSNDTRVAEAWKFLTYLTTKPDGTFVSTSSSGAGLGQALSASFDPAKSYLEHTGEPAARRDIIETQKNDPKIGVFATDNLIDKSWRETDPDAIESIFATMIDQVNKGQASVSDAIRTAATRVRALSK